MSLRTDLGRRPRTGHLGATPKPPILTAAWYIIPMPARNICPFDTPSVSPASIEPSVGSVGDSYDNALAESVIGLYKTELIREKGPWRNLDHLEYATLEYVDWFNHRRILEPIGDIPPTEREANYYSQQSPAPLAGLKQTSLRGRGWCGGGGLVGFGGV